VTELGQGPTTLHLIVPSPDGRSLLVQADDQRAGRRLPEVALDGPGDELMAPVLAAIAGLLGPDVPLLRVAPIGLTWGHRVADVVAEMEATGTLEPPDGLAWNPLSDLGPASFAREAIRPLIGRWLDEQRSGVPSAKRPVWSRPGFLARAGAWMADQLEAAGTPLTSPPRLTQLWGISAFLEGETPTGKVFFKSCAAVFPTEAQITLAIDRALPGVGPSVVAIEPEQRWLLMRDAGGSALGDGPPERRSVGLAEFGRAQRAWPAAVARLPPEDRIGLEDRSPASLAAMLPVLVDDPGLAGLAPAHRERLHAELPDFVERCARIEELGPPNTLVHGDFHPWNVHDDGERISIIDWSDACIGHPFFDLPTYLGRTRDVTLRRAILDAYLDAWSNGFDRAALEEAALLGLVLGSLHQVESYRRIMASLDPEDEWDIGEGMQNYARRALVWLDMGLDAIDPD